MADLHHLHEGRAVLRLPIKVDIRDGAGVPAQADTVAVVGLENYPYRVVSVQMSRLGFQGQAETICSLQKLPGWPPLPH